LFEFLVGWMGGPPLYAQKHGPARLGQRHRQFPIGDAERDAWMQCMDQALDEVVADKALRQELHQAFLKTATFLRNR
jgi:hemoglobin